MSVKKHKDAYYYIHDSANLKIGKQHINFFERIVKEKFVYVLTNNINKRIGSDCLNQDKETNKIRSVCMIKKITLSDLEDI